MQPALPPPRVRPAWALIDLLERRYADALGYFELDLGEIRASARERLLQACGGYAGLDKELKGYLLDPERSDVPALRKRMEIPGDWVKRRVDLLPDGKEHIVAVTLRGKGRGRLVFTLIGPRHNELVSGFVEPSTYRYRLVGFDVPGKR